jgi:exodeoxyribonuclease V beta subunit
MRLETDTELVQVITFHKAKGLQYPLVFLPFVSNFKEDKDESLRTPEDRLGEDIRLLYVALTRAQQAMWLGVAPRKDDFKAKAKATSNANAKSRAQSPDDVNEVPIGKSALSVLLRRESAEDLALKLNAWQECADIHVTIAPTPNMVRYEGLSQAESKDWTPAKKPSRVLPRAGWTASFSALTRNLVETNAQGLNPAFERDERWLDSQIDNPVVNENSSVDSSTLAAIAVTSTNATTDSTLDQAQPIYNAFPAGSAYGTLLHDIFEWQLKEGWPLLQSETDVSAETHLRWQAWWQTQANSLQLSPEHQALCLDLIRQCAATPLNQLGSEQHCFGDQAWAPLSLSQLNTHNAWPEMGFTLKTHGVSSEHIDQLIRSSLHEGQSRPALQAQQLNGLLTGFMDIVLAHQGRYYVLDYKSNKLPSYEYDSLVSSMLSHRYEVQYTLYILAVHRLLKSRLPNYDYEQHMGGALYLYLRGIDQAGQGVYFSRPAYELIHALDLAFQGHAIETLSEVQS